jgi:SulP family sulfate permease
VKGWLKQVSSGLVLGLSAVIYAVAFAALMFSGPLSPYVAYGMTLTLIAAATGGLYGLLSEEPTFVSGPDSNTTSLLAGTLAAFAATLPPGVPLLHGAVALLLVASITTALTYLLLERFGTARLVRFIPFQVMAGFLAATGWLMCSGALNIIAGLPLSMEGLAAFIDAPWRPELLAGVLLAAALSALARRFSAALVIPAFMVAVSVGVNLVVRGLCPPNPACHPDRWFFRPFSKLEWLPPWQLQVDSGLAMELLRLAPSLFAVAFVGTLTVLLSLSSLELAYRRDFRLEPALRLHGRMTLATAALGGYLSLISIGRSTLSRQTGGGRYTGLVAAAVCVAVILGLGGLLAWIPKVALGALVLYLGVGMLRQWLWDLRGELSRVDLLHVVGILTCVIAFGYVVGILAGLVSACIFFVVHYSRLPFIRLDTTLARVRSSVIRDVADQQFLSASGSSCRVARFEGLVFFGVANSIYEWYRASAAGQHRQLVLDFSLARGMDPSALAVLHKIMRAEAAQQRRAILCLDPEVCTRVAPGTPAHLVPSFDAALELAEDLLLRERNQAGGAPAVAGALNFFDSIEDRIAFLGFLQRIELAQGQPLFHEGQASGEAYFVESGELEVVKATAQGRPIRLAKVVPGSMIGEMALYSGKPRTASVVAAAPAVLRALTRAGWERMRLQRPELAAQFDHHVVLSLAATVERANAALSQQG